MSKPSLFAIHEGQLLPLPAPNHGGIHEALAHAPPGVYSALRTYRGHQFLALDAHLERCRRSLERAGWQLPMDFAALSKALDTVARAGDGDQRIRFDLLQQPFCQEGKALYMLLAAAPHEEVSSSVMLEGAQLALAPAGLARRAPLIKFTRWVEERAVCTRTQPDAFEHLLLDEQGCILEGISSNFFAVQNGRLITSPDGLLEGITRGIVLELARELGMEVCYQRLALHELGNCQEAFITSATREVVPVRSVADTLIGSGQPGPRVQDLRDAYAAYARQHARPARLA